MGEQTIVVQAHELVGACWPDRRDFARRAEAQGTPGRVTYTPEIWATLREQFRQALRQIRPEFKAWDE